jgi:hypothetical protein
MPQWRRIRVLILDSSILRSKLGSKHGISESELRHLLIGTRGHLGLKVFDTDHGWRWLVKVDTEFGKEINAYLIQDPKDDVAWILKTALYGRKKRKKGK